VQNLIKCEYLGLSIIIDGQFWMFKKYSLNTQKEGGGKDRKGVCYEEDSFVSSGGSFVDRRVGAYEL
jgi:hypothetical protein